LDGYREYIIDSLKEGSFSASRIYREIQERGFTGKYTIVKDFVREIRPKTGVPAVYRYETKPGIQGQADWAECGRVGWADACSQGDELASRPWPAHGWPRERRTGCGQGRGRQAERGHEGKDDEIALLRGHVLPSSSST